METEFIIKKSSNRNVQIFFNLSQLAVKLMLIAIKIFNFQFQWKLEIEGWLIEFFFPFILFVGFLVVLNAIIEFIFGDIW